MSKEAKGRFTEVLAFSHLRKLIFCSANAVSRQAFKTLLPTSFLPINLSCREIWGLPVLWQILVAPSETSISCRTSYTLKLFLHVVLYQSRCTISFIPSLIEASYYPDTHNPTRLMRRLLHCSCFVWLFISCNMFHSLSVRYMGSGHIPLTTSVVITSTNFLIMHPH